MTYRVQKNKKIIKVIEKDTKLVVYTTKKEIEARSMCRSLNLGSGFCGFTPEFFAEDKQKERPTPKR